MNRRALLAILGSTALAGCTELTETLESPETAREPYGTDGDGWVSTRAEDTDTEQTLEDRPDGESILEDGALAIREHDIRSIDSARRHPNQNGQTVLEGVVAHTGGDPYENIVIHTRLYDDDGDILDSASVQLEEQDRVLGNTYRKDSLGYLEADEQWPFALVFHTVEFDTVAEYDIAIAGVQSDGERGDSTLEHSPQLVFDQESPLVSGEQGQHLWLICEDLPASVDELSLELDTTVLTEHGVVLEEPTLESVYIEGRQRGPAADFALEIVAVREDALELRIQTLGEAAVYCEFYLAGLDTTDARSGTDLEYNVELSEMEVTAQPMNSFDIVTPGTRQPTVSSNWLYTEADGQRQRLSIDWLYPEKSTLRLDIDLTPLETYGSLEEVTIEDTEFYSATVDDHRFEDGKLSVTLSPEPDAVVVRGQVHIEGITITETEEIEEISYAVSLEGDSHETADVEPFRIVSRETDEDPVPEDDDEAIDD